MRHISEFMEWAASHAVLRETGGMLYVDKTVIGTDPWKYLFGTTGRACTQSLLDSKYKQYYKGWGWSKSAFDRATAGWAGKVAVCDCQGLEDKFSGSDTNAKGNYARYCSDEYKGAVSDIVRPYVFGEAIFCGSTPSNINHVMWVVGQYGDEPIVLHERGLSHGCVIERLSKTGKKATYRGLMDKRYEYTIIAENTAIEDEPIDEPDERELSLKSPMMRGEDVRALQARLAALGYTVGTIDGIYGSKTDAAVRAYQVAAFAVIHGLVDEATRRLLGL